MSTYLISFLLTGNPLPPIAPVVCHPGWAVGLSHLRPVIWSSLRLGSCHPLQVSALVQLTVRHPESQITLAGDNGWWATARVYLRISPSCFNSTLCKRNIPNGFWAHAKRFSADSCHIPMSIFSVSMSRCISLLSSPHAFPLPLLPLPVSFHASYLLIPLTHM